MLRLQWQENCGVSRSCRSWVRGALFDSGYIFCVSEGDFWTRLLRAHLVLLFFLWPRTSSTTAVACIVLVLLVFMRLALCSHGFIGDDAPRAVFPTFVLRCQPELVQSDATNIIPLSGAAEPYVSSAVSWTSLTFSS